MNLWHLTRYNEIFERRITGGASAPQDIADLQMSFNLAWVAPECLSDELALHQAVAPRAARCPAC